MPRASGQTLLEANHQPIIFTYLSICKHTLWLWFWLKKLLTLYFILQFSSPWFSMIIWRGFSLRVRSNQVVAFAPTSRFFWPVGAKLLTQTASELSKLAGGQIEMLLLQHTKLNFLLFSLPPCWLPPAGENMSKSCGIFCFPNPQSHSKYPESQQSQILDGPKPLLPTQRYKAENTESSNV